jgi:hypothetical protein
MPVKELLLEGEPDPGPGVADVGLYVGHRLDVPDVEEQGVGKGLQVFRTNGATLTGAGG